MGTESLCQDTTEWDKKKAGTTPPLANLKTPTLIAKCFLPTARRDSGNKEFSLLCWHVGQGPPDRRTALPGLQPDRRYSTLVALAGKDAAARYSAEAVAELLYFKIFVIHSFGFLG